MGLKRIILGFFERSRLAAGFFVLEGKYACAKCYMIENKELQGLQRRIVGWKSGLELMGFLEFNTNGECGMGEGRTEVRPTGELLAPLNFFLQKMRG